MIKYVKGSLFNSPEGSIRLHACNCEGKWGSGIAKEFARLYPDARDTYRDYCLKNKSVLGKSLLIEERDCKIACVMTSKSYGSHVSSPSEIIASTDQALKHFLEENKGITEIHSNKFNSGLFHVPWEDTEALVNKHLNNYKSINWTVWVFP